MSESSLLKRCEFVCLKKKRQCKLLAKKERRFCGEHFTYSEENKQDDRLKRIPCPLDPKHSISAKDLDNHLKKCNSREVTLGSFDVKDVNTFASDVDEEDTREEILNFSLKTLAQSEIDELIEYICQLDSELNLSKPLEKIYKEDDFINQEINSNYTGETSLKHLKQISSIVGHIKESRNADSQKKECFIELGAGRGKLSHWLSLSLKDSNVKYLLVERGSQRFKFDGQHSGNETSFNRIRMDIKNLYLSELDLVKECDQLTLYGKHLCGPATDFTLRSLKRTLKEEDKKFTGLFLAVCCHHYLEWNLFCGKKFFKKFNLTRKQFYMIRNMTSWATCGPSQSTTTECNENEKHLDKEKIGYMCKNLIDMARSSYLANNDDDVGNNNEIKFSTKLFYYCDKNVTLENRMLFVAPLKC